MTLTSTGTQCAPLDVQVSLQVTVMGCVAADAIPGAAARAVATTASANNGRSLLIESFAFRGTRRIRAARYESDVPPF